jgi:nucleotide-binding universal stress UspA family protein
MFKNVLVPLDGSALAARSLPFAKRVAHAASARLIVVRAYLPADDALSVRVKYPRVISGRARGCGLRDRAG